MNTRVKNDGALEELTIQYKCDRQIVNSYPGVGDFHRKRIGGARRLSVFMTKYDFPLFWDALAALIIIKNTLSFFDSISSGLSSPVY